MKKLTLLEASKIAAKLGYRWIAVDSNITGATDHIIMAYDSKPICGTRFWNHIGKNEVIGLYIGGRKWFQTLTKCMT